MHPLFISLIEFLPLDAAFSLIHVKLSGFMQGAFYYCWRTAICILFVIVKRLDVKCIAFNWSYCSMIVNIQAICIACVDWILLLIYEVLWYSATFLKVQIQMDLTISFPNSISKSLDINYYFSSWVPLTSMSALPIEAFLNFSRIS